MTTFEESTLSMFEKLINRIGELEVKASKTEEPVKPVAETNEKDEKQIEADVLKGIGNMVDEWIR